MDMTAKPAQPECGEHPHHHAAVRFKVDFETIEVHTDHLTVREILDLVEADPEKHYLVELSDSENTPRTDLNETIALRDCLEFITVFTGETPVS